MYISGDNNDACHKSKLRAVRSYLLTGNKKRDAQLSISLLYFWFGFSFFASGFSFYFCLSSAFCWSRAST